MSNDVVIASLNDTQRAVYEALRNAGEAGHTHFELSEMLGADRYSTYRTRCSELVALGLVRYTGRTRKYGGKEHKIWALAEFVPDEVPQPERHPPRKDAEKVYILCRNFIHSNKVSGPDDPRLPFSKMGRLLREIGPVVGWYQEEK